MEDGSNTPKLKYPVETEPARLFGNDITAAAGFMSDFILGQASLRREPKLQCPRILSELILCRCVDRALTYVSSILELIYYSQPKALRSHAKVTIEDVLRCKTMEEFLRQTIERKVLELSYKSINQLDTYLFDKIGVSLFSECSTREIVVELVETRNLVVHNRSLVNERFLQNVPNTTNKLGAEVAVSELAANEFIVLMEWVLDLDSRLIEKFNLPAQPRIARPPIGRL